MAEKDITEKILMSYADVFSDCINTLVYRGRRRLGEGNTSPAPTESFYKREKQHNQFSDTSRYLVEGGNIKAQYIIENETQLRERQVLRKVSYQGGAYRQQVESGIPAYAVVGIVMAWTGKGHRIPTSLHELLEREGVPPEELEHTDDAELAVYHMNSLPEETRKLFTSDMGFVADYLNEGSFEGRKGQEIVHLEALCDMMEALTGDTRFTVQAQELMKEAERKEGGIMMSEYINMLEARGEARGVVIGEARGEARGVAIGEARGVAIGEARGEARGVVIGEARGEAKLSRLLEQLFELGRDKEARLAVRDAEARAGLYKEFRIEDAADGE